MSDILSGTECERLWTCDPNAGRKAFSRYSAAAERHAGDALALSVARFENDAQTCDDAARYARRGAVAERDDPAIPAWR